MRNPGIRFHYQGQSCACCPIPVVFTSCAR